MEDNTNAEKVTVEERANGSMRITYRDISLRFKEITTRPKREQREPKINTSVTKKAYIPPLDHPWRKFRLPGSASFKEKEEALVGAL